jgi:hypothetical protein
VATIVLSPSNVVASPRVGGHFWVYLQYALGLRGLGCDVYWLEQVPPSGDAAADAARLAAFHERMRRHGLGDRSVLYRLGPRAPAGAGERVYLNRSRAFAEALFRRADLLLNFHYAMDPELLARFRRTALVDIDPGLLQFWISAGQLRVARHDLHFTIGETVGTPGARFPDCGLAWTRIRSPIWLPAWPPVPLPAAGAFTTVSSWWGGRGGGEWVRLGRDAYYDNNKRASFLDFVELPRRTEQILELALSLGEGVPIDGGVCTAGSERGEAAAPVRPSGYPSEAEDMELLRRHGWRLRHARDVAGGPEEFRAYVHGSRGEFSCAKPSCMAFQNAWISDRTLCYLASAKPVVVQDTGPSATLPNGLGIFRFRSLGEAAEALASVDANYAKHSRAARELAEAYFDARAVLPPLLDAALRGSRGG